MVSKHGLWIQLFLKVAYFDGLDLKLESGVLIDNNHGVRVQLERRKRPHVVNTLLNAALDRKSVV